MRNAYIYLIIFLSSFGALYAQTSNLPAIPTSTAPAVALSENEILFTDDANEADDTQKPKNTNGFLLLLQAIFSLSLVLALVYGLVYFLKQISSKTTATSNTIQILSSKSLTSSTSLHIVEVENQVFLIGSGDNINLITEFTNQETIDSLRLKSATEKETPQNFIALFKERLNLENLEILKAPRKDFLSNQTERLNNLKNKSLANNGLENEVLGNNNRELDNNDK